MVYVGERGQNRIEVFTTDGKFVKEFYVSPNTPSRAARIAAVSTNTKMPPCGTTYKLAISRDPQQKYLYVADGTNDTVWILDRAERQDARQSFGGNGTLRRPVPLDQRDRDGLEGQHLHGRGGTGQANPEVRARHDWRAVDGDPGSGIWAGWLKPASTLIRLLTPDSQTRDWELEVGGWAFRYRPTASSSPLRTAG